MSYWHDKTVMVTGAAAGIGKVIAATLAREKTKTIITDINETALQATAAELRAAFGAEVLPLAGDVSKKATVESWFEQTMTRFGRLDFLVNNAGITRDGLMLRMKEEDWDSVLNINLKGSFLCCQQAAKVMIKARQPDRVGCQPGRAGCQGRIVNIASVVGVYGNAGQVNYSASKAGIIGLTKTLAKELGSRNILVNAVAPGFIETDMTKKLPETYIEEIKKRIPLGRLGLPQDVADLVKFLLAPESAYLTGQVICIDGGLII